MGQIKVFSTGTNLQNFGGAQKMMVDIHNGLKSHFDAKILGTCSFEELNKNYSINRDEYINLKNPFLLKDSTILLHARKLTTYYHLLNKIFSLNLKIIYIAHNTYNEKRLVTFLPKTIISISNKVTENLLSYFKVKKDYIFKIPNGIEDKIELFQGQITNKKHKAQITILYAARVTSVKRQVDIVKNIKGKLANNIHIVFAGVGPQLDELRTIIGDSTNFSAPGFIKNMHEYLIGSDYVMLFSEKEGLPISLMEGTMYAKPLIINDVGGNTEIGLEGKNAFLANSWTELVDVLNSLPKPLSQEYTLLSKNSREIYDLNFKYEMMIDKYLFIINRLNNGKQYEDN